MIVAQNQRRPVLRAKGQRGERQDPPPARDVVVARLIRQRRAEHIRRIPVRQQRRLVEQPCLVVWRERRPAPLGDCAVQHRQCIDRQGIERAFIGAAVQQARVNVIAEIFDQQKSVLAVFGVDLRGAEAQIAQHLGNRDIRSDVLHRRRRIHQHGPPTGGDQPVVAPERCIAGEHDRCGTFPSRGREKPIQR
jgi:hypothetical protein